MYDILSLQAWYEQFYRLTDQAGNFLRDDMGQYILPRLYADAYGYPVVFNTFNAVSGTASGNLQINANADFVLTRISYVAVLAAQTVSTKTVAQIRCQITDGGSARPFWNSAVALENFACNEFPTRFLAIPKFIPANSSLGLQLTGFGTGAETYATVELFLEGVSVKRFG